MILNIFLFVGVIYLVIQCYSLLGAAITLHAIYNLLIAYGGAAQYVAYAMFIFALFPLLALFAQPLGEYSYWYPIIIIGIAGAAHQSWSANIQCFYP